MDPSALGAVACAKRYRHADENRDVPVYSQRQLEFLEQRKDAETHKLRCGMVVLRPSPAPSCLPERTRAPAFLSAAPLSPKPSPARICLGPGRVVGAWW